MKITVLGSGNMGGALVRGWAKAARQHKAEIALVATARTMNRLNVLQSDYPEVEVSTSNTEAVKGADVAVVAVKPWLVAEVLAEVKPFLTPDCVVVSVAASAEDPSIDVYVMPNIAAEFGESMTFVLQDKSADPEKVQKTARLMELLGKVMVVGDRQMKAGGMMAGCGIAYVMRMVRAMMEGGVEMGLYPHDAQQIAMQTMLGAVSVLEQTGLHPEAAIDKVTTPGGLTIKGLNELDHAGFSSAVVRCLKAGLE